MTLVLCTAEAPNINFAKEVYDLDLMANTIRAIFLVPRMARSGFYSVVTHVTM